MYSLSSSVEMEQHLLDEFAQMKLDGAERRLLDFDLVGLRKNCSIRFYIHCTGICIRFITLYLLVWQVIPVIFCCSRTRS